MIPTDSQLQAQLHERLEQLPQVVKAAIASSDIEGNLRKLADTHKLHLDQWQSFENEVMLAILGIQRVEDLEQNIKKEAGVNDDVARALSLDVNRIVFEPIRLQLERNLEHPDAQAAVVSGTEAARTQALDEAHAEAMSSAPAVTPATPPAPTPDIRITRPTDASAYKPGEPSHVRTAVHDDPYREPPV